MSMGDYILTFYNIYVKAASFTPMAFTHWPKQEREILQTHIFTNMNLAFW